MARVLATRSAGPGEDDFPPRHEPGVLPDLGGSALGASQSCSSEVLNFRLRMTHSYPRPGRRREVYVVSQEHRNNAARSSGISAQFQRRGHRDAG